MKKYLTITTILICTILLFSACAQTGAPVASETQAASNEKVTSTDPVVMKFAMSSGATSEDVKAIQAMSDRIGKKTNGGLTIEVYPNNELGSIADVVEMIEGGAPILTVTSADFLSDYSPDHAALNGAYLYDSWEDFKIINDSEWYAGLKKDIAAKGIHVMLFGWNGGNRHMISTFPIKSIDDLTGKKARVSGGLMFVEMYKALGAAPVTLPFSEVYQGLQQGIVDVAEMQLYNMRSISLQEVCPYITLTNHIIGADTIFMGEEMYNKLSPEFQTILVDELNTTAVEYGNSVTALQEECIKFFKEKGLTVTELTDEQMNDFVEKSKGMYDNISTLTPGITDTIREIIAAGK